MLFRVFPFLEDADPQHPGGALYVPRDRQGVGRHDAPERYGALYVSRSRESAVAERIQAFRGQTLTDADLRLVDGRRFALAAIDDDRLDGVVDLDDPHELAERDLRPSRVATRRRDVTQAIARAIFDEGSGGFAWWSTLEASWSNVTLFAERALPGLSLRGEPEILTIDHPALGAAAEAIGVRLG